MEGSICRFVVFWMILFATCTSQLFSQYETCQWDTEPPAGCSEPWSFYSYDTWVVISTSPPCSVKVHVTGQRRCAQVEITEMSTVPLAPNKIVTSPPNCTDGDGWDSWTRSNTVDYKYQVYDAIANDVMNIYINAHGGMMGCCPCPNGAKSVESKFMSCANNMFVFDRDFGGPVSIRYDPSQNWAYYLGVMQSMFGYNPRISTVTCHGEACCYRVREFCIQNQSLVSVTDSGWQVLGDCEEAEDPCDLILCNHEDP